MDTVYLTTCELCYLYVAPLLVLDWFVSVSGCNCHVMLTSPGNTRRRCDHNCLQDIEVAIGCLLIKMLDSSASMFQKSTRVKSLGKASVSKTEMDEIKWFGNPYSGSHGNLAWIGYDLD